MTETPRLVSVIIPVYNGARTVGDVVAKIHECFHDVSTEVILVNDGSQDDSERICTALAVSHPDSVHFVHLTRNFGEHNAVMAGLRYASGDCAVIIDDEARIGFDPDWLTARLGLEPS